MVDKADGVPGISRTLSGESPKADSTEPEEVVRDDAPELPGAVTGRTPSLALSLRGGSMRLRGGTSKTPSLAISVTSLEWKKSCTTNRKYNIISYIYN